MNQLQCPVAVKNKIKILENIRKISENKTKIIILLCRSMVCPHLEYCVQFGSSPPQKGYGRTGKGSEKGNKDNHRYRTYTYKEQLSKLGLLHLEER